MSGGKVFQVTGGATAMAAFLHLAFSWFTKESVSLDQGI